MRIIAGKYKGKKLISPKTEKTRPTLDRIKEALFSILTPYISEASVLDLFAGTGNLGIESISRGAKFAWLNDIENSSISNILGNVKLTNLENCVKITKKDYIKCLNQIEKSDTQFDIIFIDPPYNTNFMLKSLEYLNNSKILSKNGVIVCEMDKRLEETREKIGYEYTNLECVTQKTYGRVILKLYKWR